MTHLDTALVAVEMIGRIVVWTLYELGLVYHLAKTLQLWK